MAIYNDLPFDQAGGHGGTRSTTQMVVIHATFNTASDEAEAHYAEHRSDQVSAHFYTDADSAIQALDTDVVAYGCYPTGNSRSVQFELCGLDWDTNPPGPGAVADATMRRIAPVVARVCRDYGIPIRKIGPAELRAGTRGICGHADVTAAWGEGDHTDPGAAFPWVTFVGYVQDAANPRPESQEDDDMPSAISIDIPTTPGKSKTVNIGPSNVGAAGLGPAWVSMAVDGRLGKLVYRIAISDGHGHFLVVAGDGKPPLVLDAANPSWGYGLADGWRQIVIDCLDGSTYASDMTIAVEYGRRG